MPLRVFTNVPAINVRRILNINNRDLKTRIERLSSGLRINRAADDAAGLSVSEGMRAEVTGLNQAVRNGTLVVHSDGSQTRDYVFIDDVVNAMVAAATASEVDKLKINVGCGSETSVRELANLVMKTTQSNAEVIYNPRTDPGVSRMCADLTLAREKLGYQPSTSLADGLRLTLEHDPRFQHEVTRPIQKEA